MSYLCCYMFELDKHQLKLYLIQLYINNNFFETMLQEITVFFICQSDFFLSKFPNSEIKDIYIKSTYHFN